MTERREASRKRTDIISIAQINSLQRVTMGYPSENPPPYRASRHSRRQQWKISVPTSPIFSQISSHRQQLMDVLNEQRFVCRPVWFSARYPATGSSWWMCSTNNGLHPFWAHRQNTRKAYPLKTKTLPFIAKVQVPWLYDKDPSFQLGGCVRFCFEHGLTSVSTYDF